MKDGPSVSLSQERNKEWVLVSYKLLVFKKISTEKLIMNVSAIGIAHPTPYLLRLRRLP